MVLRQIFGKGLDKDLGDAGITELVAATRDDTARELRLRVSKLKGFEANRAVGVIKFGVLGLGGKKRGGGSVRNPTSSWPDLPTYLPFRLDSGGS